MKCLLEMSQNTGKSVASETQTYKSLHLNVANEIIWNKYI